MLKLAICLLLSLVTLASSDSSYSSYQPFQQSYEQQSAPSGYQYPGYPAQRRHSFLDTLRDSFFPQRRQDFFGIGPIFAFVCLIVIVFVIIGIIGIVAGVGNITSSGRGLDSDVWEVDHSVWMDQLEKDFEESWSQN